MRIALSKNHRVGVVFEDEKSDRIRPRISSNLARQFTPLDFAAAARFARAIQSLVSDILHVHGANGDGFAREIGTFLRAIGLSVARIFSSTGGSFRHAAEPSPVR